VFIGYWLKSNCFSPNEELLSRMQLFCDEAIPSQFIANEGAIPPEFIANKTIPLPLVAIAKETRHLIETYQEAPLTALRLPNPNEPILKSSGVEPRDLAIALGLLEGDNYKALRPSDYLEHLSKGQSNKVDIYIETHEKIKLWVIKSILHSKTVSSRSNMMKFYLKTALVSPRLFFSIMHIILQSAGMPFNAKLLVDGGDSHRP
jgi:hypothetical protein